MFANNPALVLNADFQPLSYFPLSLFRTGRRGAVGGEGLSRGRGRVRSGRAQPSTTMRLPSVIGAARLCAAAGARGFHALQRGPARPLQVPVLRSPAPASDLTFDDVLPRRAAARPAGKTSSRRARRATRRRTSGSSSRCGHRFSRPCTSRARRRSSSAELHVLDLVLIISLGCRARG